jgi:two-component SAPR family response regulator
VAMLLGKRILVLEDEFLIALEAAEILRQAGATVVGPAYHIDEAFRLIDAVTFDGALLDVNIGGSLSIAVADILISKNMPIVFATGYGDKADGLVGQVVLDKPYTREQVEKAFARVLSA